MMIKFEIQIMWNLKKRNPWVVVIYGEFNLLGCWPLFRSSQITPPQDSNNGEMGMLCEYDEQPLFLGEELCDAQSKSFVGA